VEAPHLSLLKRSRLEALKAAEAYITANGNAPAV